MLVVFFISKNFGTNSILFDRQLYDCNRQMTMWIDSRWIYYKSNLINMTLNSCCSLRKDLGIDSNLKNFQNHWKVKSNEFIFAESQAKLLAIFVLDFVIFFFCWYVCVFCVAAIFCPKIEWKLKTKLFFNNQWSLFQHFKSKWNFFVEICFLGFVLSNLNRSNCRSFDWFSI